MGTRKLEPIFFKMRDKWIDIKKEGKYQVKNGEYEKIYV